MEIPPDILQEEANHDIQQPYNRILCCGRYNALFREAVAGLDTEAFRVVLSSISWFFNERRVSGVAVTRHSVFVVPSVSVGIVDVNGKIDDPAVTVECPRQIMLDDATPSFRESLLDRLSPRTIGITYA